jgi:hypothetical protein
MEFTSSMESKAGRQVQALMRSGHYTSTVDHKCDDVGVSRVAACAGNYEKHYKLRHPFFIHFFQDPKEKTLQMKACYVGPAYKDATSGVVQCWTFGDFIPFYWHVNDAQREAREATLAQAPEVEDKPLRCGCCCRKSREVKKKKRDSEYEAKWWAAYRTNIDRIASEWTSLHAAFVAQKYDKQVDDFLRKPCCVVAEDVVIEARILQGVFTTSVTSGANARITAPESVKPSSEEPSGDETTNLLMHT